MHFNDVLSQFDLFTEVVTQRSEHGTGVWLSGLDVLAARGAGRLDLPASSRRRSVCYLARGPGAAIRRARTRLPGGRPNPVAIIRVPRERMVGHGIASSLVHEVGHQGAALLGLVESLRAEIARAQRGRDPGGRGRRGSSWICEIVADFWSVGKLGIGSTLGLLAVVSLPRVLRLPARPATDPHPMPYVRVLLSAPSARPLYPHPQWRGAAADLARALPRRRPAGRPPAGDRQRIEGHAGDRPMLMRRTGRRLCSGRQLGDAACRWPSGGRSSCWPLHRAWRDDLGRAGAAAADAGLRRARSGPGGRPDRPRTQESRAAVDVLTAWAVRSSLDVIQRPAHQPPASAAGVVRPLKGTPSRQDRWMHRHPHPFQVTGPPGPAPTTSRSTTRRARQFDFTGAYRRRDAGGRTDRPSSTTWSPAGRLRVPDALRDGGRVVRHQPTPTARRATGGGTVPVRPAPPAAPTPPPVRRWSRLDRGAAPDDRRGAVRPSCELHEARCRLQGVLDRVVRPKSPAGPDRASAGDRRLPRAARGRRGFLSARCGCSSVDRRAPVASRAYLTPTSAALRGQPSRSDYPDARSAGDPCSDLNPDLLAEAVRRADLGYWMRRPGSSRRSTTSWPGSRTAGSCRGRSAGPLRPQPAAAAAAHPLVGWRTRSRGSPCAAGPRSTFEYGLPLVGRAVPPRAASWRAGAGSWRPSTRCCTRRTCSSRSTTTRP